MAARRVLRTTLALGALAVLMGADRPGEARVQLRFGVDMAQQGSWKEAEFRFQRAAGLAPGDPEILNNLAVAYENNGRYEEATKEYLRALELDPQNERIRENYERFRLFLADYTRKKEERDAPVPAPEEEGVPVKDPSR